MGACSSVGEATRRYFRNEGCCARAVSDTRKGGEREVSSPLSLCFVLSFSTGVSDSRSVGLDAVRRDANAYPPNIDSLARGTHASQRVSYRGRLSPRRFRTGLSFQVFPESDFPRDTARLISKPRSRQVFFFWNLKRDLKGRLKGFGQK